MKKVLAILATLILVVPSISSCNNNNNENSDVSFDSENSDVSFDSENSDVSFDSENSDISFDSEKWLNGEASNKGKMINSFLENKANYNTVDIVKELLGEPDYTTKEMSPNNPNLPTGNYTIGYYLDDKEYINEKDKIEFIYNVDDKYKAYKKIKGKEIIQSDNFNISALMIFEDVVDFTSMKDQIKELLNNVHYGYVKDNKSIDLNDVYPEISIGGFSNNNTFLEGLFIDLKKNMLFKLSNSMNIEYYSNLSKKQLKLIDEIFGKEVNKRLNARYQLTSLIPDLASLNTSNVYKIKYNVSNGNTYNSYLETSYYTTDKTDIKNCIDLLNQDLYRDYYFNPGDINNLSYTSYTYFNNDETNINVLVYGDGIFEIDKKYYKLVSGNPYVIKNKSNEVLNFSSKMVQERYDVCDRMHLSIIYTYMDLTMLEFKECEAIMEDPLNNYYVTIEGILLPYVYVLDERHFYFEEKNYEIVGDLDFKGIIDEIQNMWK